MGKKILFRIRFTDLLQVKLNCKYQDQTQAADGFEMILILVFEFEIALLLSNLESSTLHHFPFKFSTA